MNMYLAFELKRQSFPLIMHCSRVYKSKQRNSTTNNTGVSLDLRDHTS